MYCKFLPKLVARFVCGSSEDLGCGGHHSNLSNLTKVSQTIILHQQYDAFLTYVLFSIKVFFGIMWFGTFVQIFGGEEEEEQGWVCGQLSILGTGRHSSPAPAAKSMNTTDKTSQECETALTSQFGSCSGAL